MGNFTLENIEPLILPSDFRLAETNSSCTQFLYSVHFLWRSKFDFLNQFDNVAFLHLARHRCDGTDNVFVPKTVITIQFNLCLVSD